MKVALDRMRPAYGDGGWQEGIDTAHPGGDRTLNRWVKMHHLPRRMYAGIGSPCTDNRNRNTCDLLQRRLKRILDGIPTRLSLPSTEGTPVILDTQSKSHLRPLDQQEIAAIDGH